MLGIVKTGRNNVKRNPQIITELLEISRAQATPKTLALSPLRIFQNSKMVKAPSMNSELMHSTYTGDIIQNIGVPIKHIRPSMNSWNGSLNSLNQMWNCCILTIMTPPLIEFLHTQGSYLESKGVLHGFF